MSENKKTSVGLTRAVEFKLLDWLRGRADIYTAHPPESWPALAVECTAMLRESTGNAEVTVSGVAVKAICRDGGLSIKPRHRGWFSPGASAQTAKWKGNLTALAAVDDGIVEYLGVSVQPTPDGKVRVYDRPKGEPAKPVLESIRANLPAAVR